jgi:hypothetical protein
MMGRPPHIYEAFDKDGNFIMSGTALELSKALGMGNKTVCHVAAGCYGHSKYRIVDITAIEQEQTREAAEAWDKFCAPIRKKYGIPVKKG